MKRLTHLALVFVLSLGLAACNTSTAANTDPAPTALAAQTEELREPEKETLTEEAGRLTVTHDLGTTEVPTDPEKVVVMDLGILDILDSVGIEVGGLPKASVPNYLSRYAGDAYISGGGMKDMDFEAVNEYSPDLIIISGRLSNSYEENAKIAPTLYVTTPGATYMESFKANIDLLSRIYPSKAAEMQQKYADIESAAAGLREEASASGLNALFIMANDGAISVYGAGSRYGIIYDDLGFAPADAGVESSTHGQEISFEYIQEINPDILFVMDRSAAIGTEGATGAQALLDNDFINNTNAAENDRIVYLSSDIWYLVSGGINSTSMMIEEVSRALQ